MLPLPGEDSGRKGEPGFTGERLPWLPLPLAQALPAREAAAPSRGVVSPEFEVEVDVEVAVDVDDPGVMVDERDRTGISGSCIPIP